MKRNREQALGTVRYSPPQVIESRFKQVATVLEFLNNIRGLKTERKRFVVPARQTTYRLAESIPQNRFLGSFKV
jgi:hypothetical protein